MSNTNKAYNETEMDNVRFDDDDDLPSLNLSNYDDDGEQRNNKLRSESVVVRSPKSDQKSVTRNEFFPRDAVFVPSSTGTLPQTTTDAVNTTIANSNFRIAQQMTVAGSFLDFALFVADVEHLKFLIDSGKENVEYYNFLMGLLITSLVLQIIVIVLMYFAGFRQPKTRSNSAGDQVSEEHKSTILNILIISMVTCIAIVNVFVTVFGNRSEKTLIAKFEAEKARYANQTHHSK